MKIRSIIKALIDLICTAAASIYYLIPSKIKIVDQRNNNKIIVSLTTIPERINTVWITIESILHQSILPDKIILYLAEDQFKGKKIPKRLTKLEKRGLSIVFCEDLKPHKKYYYTMVNYPNEIVITVDDDSIYSRDLIKTLMESYEKYPNCVSCMRAHEIVYEKNGFPAIYRNWNKRISGMKGIPSEHLLAVGKGGVLYPPHAIPIDGFDKEAIIKYSLYADDIWLKIMELKNGVKVVKASNGNGYCPDIFATQEFALYKKNVAGEKNKEDRNDVYMNLLWKRYINSSNDICLY